MRFAPFFLSSVCGIVAFLSSSPESRGQTPGYQWANFVGLPGGPGNADAVGSIARFHDAYGVAVDASGNVYIADSSNDAIRQITPNGTTTTFAGYTEADGFKNATGTAARLDGPRGAAFDSSGNLYVTEYYNNCVRMITPSGVVTTFAGSRTFGNLDGPAATAEFNGPHGITVDSSGVVYVADTGNHTIRKIAGGMVTTIAGTGTAGYAPGTGTAAQFNAPIGIAVDSDGNLFVADSGNDCIRQIAPGLVVTVLAGTPTVSGSSDGTGGGAGFNNPNWIAIDASDNLYVTDTGNRTVRLVTEEGVVTTLAGSGHYGSSDGTGAGARFSNPLGIAVDPRGTGNLYVSDNDNATIRQLAPSPAGYVVTTPAGLASEDGTADGTGTAASLFNPLGAVLDSHGNLYVSMYYSNSIRMITPDGVVTTFAGGSKGSANGTGTAAQFDAPDGLAIDANNNIYVADSYNNAIRMVTVPGAVVTTIAGTVGVAGSQNGTGTAAQFNDPKGVAVDGSGNLYVADYVNQLIRKIAPGGVVTTLAGTAGKAGYNNATGAAALFSSPIELIINSAGNLVVADSGNNAIRIVTPAGVVTTLAGIPGTYGSADGPNAAATFWNPSGLAIDAAGYIYVADYNNSLVRKITPGGTVGTLGGLAHFGTSQDGVGAQAWFSGPRGLAVTSTGLVYLADALNNRVSIGTPQAPLVSVAAPTLTATSADFTSIVVNPNGTPATAEFQYGPTSAYTTTVTPALTPADDLQNHTSSSLLTGLQPATTYHYQLSAANSAGNSTTGDQTFTTPNNVATLSGLALSTGALNPGFVAATTGYTSTVDISVASITVTPTTTDPNATVTVNGTAVTSGSASGGISLAISPQVNPITCVVTAQDGTTTKTYTVAVTRIAVAPTDLTYAANPAIYTKGVAIANNTPGNAGDPVVSYVVSPSLPSGLSLDLATGVISGTPTAITSTGSYTITATNTGGFTTAAVTITVNDVAPSSLTYSPNPAVYTKSQAIIGNNPTSSGGPVVSYAVAPPLPAGLKLNPVSGTISGTPAAITSSAVYTVTATNTGGSATALVTITVNDMAPLSLAYTTNPVVYTKGVAITSNNPASNGGPVVSYAVAPPLPTGLVLNTGTGAITGTPNAVTPSAVYTVTATNTGGSAMASVAITVNDVAPSALSYSSNPAAYTKGVAIASNTPTSSGGSVVSYTVSPLLPAGLTLDSGLGVITGTPTAITSTAVYTITAANSGGSTKATVTITVNDVAPSALTYSANPATYTQGTTITSNTPGHSGGTVVSYAILPSLPAGLSLSPTTGLITGAPTAAALLGVNSYTVTATNTGGSTTATLSLTIIGTLPVATAQAVQAETHLPLAVTLSAVEPVALPTTYQMLTKPMHGVLSGTAPNLKYTSAPAYTGSDSFTFQVTDEVGTSPPATVAITVIPPISKQGRYSGHFVGLISGTEPANSGTITITSVGTGAFTGSIAFGGVTFALKGSYNTDGAYPISIARKGLSALTGNLSFGLPPGSDGITGAVGGSTLAASNTIYSGSAPTPLAGRYTVKIPSDSTQTDGSKTPQGYSVGTLVVASGGTLTFAGTLADGTKFSRGTSLTRGGVWYLFLPLYATTGPLEGMLDGTIQFESTPQVSDLDGAVTWVRPALTKLPPPATAFYPGGFNLSTHLYGTAYSSKGNLVVTPASSGNTFTAAGGSVSGGSLSEPATAGKAAASFKLTGADNLSLTLTESTGIVAGSLKETSTSLASPVNAIIYQNGSAPSIIGNFTDRPKGGPNEGGVVTLTSP